jgi:hypothetical protein
MAAIARDNSAPKIVEFSRTGLTRIALVLTMFTFALVACPRVAEAGCVVDCWKWVYYWSTWTGADRQDWRTPGGGATTGVCITYARTTSLETREEGGHCGGQTLLQTFGILNGLAYCAARGERGEYQNPGVLLIEENPFNTLQPYLCIASE